MTSLFSPSALALRPSARTLQDSFDLPCSWSRSTPTPVSPSSTPTAHGCTARPTTVLGAPLPQCHPLPLRLPTVVQQGPRRCLERPARFRQAPLVLPAPAGGE